MFFYVVILTLPFFIILVLALCFAYGSDRNDSSKDNWYKEEMKNVVYNYIYRFPGARPGEISKALAIDPSMVRVILCSLQKEERITRKTNGEYYTQTKE
jgi:predicted transcriptional regulator